MKASLLISLDYSKLKEIAQITRAINHQLRQRILNLLEEREKIKVTDIYIKLRLDQSVASQHLAILRRAGIVKTKRIGKFIYYSLNENKINKFSNLVSLW